MIKKTILIISCIIALFGCSSSDENNTIPQELIGSWKVVGYYDDVEDPETGSYHLVENGAVTNYKADNSFEYIFSSSENYNGNYSVTTDSILTMDYTTTASGDPYIYTSKISLLNENILELSDLGSNLSITRFEKVTTP